MKKRIMAILLSLIMIMCVLLSACGSTNSNTDNVPADKSPSAASPSVASPSVSGEASVPPSGDVKYAEHLDVLIHDGIAVLNPASPAAPGSAPTNYAFKMIYDPLYTLRFDDAKGIVFEPALATSYETEDYQIWTFHLRDDVYFTNGEKLTANDVVFTWNFAIANFGTSAGDYWAPVKNCTAVDEKTVKMELGTPNYDFLQNLHFPFMGILNEKAVTADPEKGLWVGTAAYKVADFVPSDYVTFERNDKFWGELPKTKTQTWTYVPEQGTQTIMMQNGDSQINCQVNVADVPMFREDPDFKVWVDKIYSPWGIGFNMDDPVCGDLNFRMAVAYALDREELVALAQQDIAEPYDFGSTWGLSTPYRNDNIKPIPKDLEKAKEYLAKSSYKGEEIEFSTNELSKLPEVIQEQLGKVGIKMTIKVMDVPSFTAHTAWTDNKSQMIGVSFMLNPNPNIGYKSNFYPESFNNRVRYNNPELAAMIDKGPALLNEEERQAHFYKMQEILAADMPVITLLKRFALVVTAKNVDGLVLPPNAMYDFRYAYMTVDK